MARSAVKRGDLVANADLDRQRRDVLTVRENLADFSSGDTLLEFAEPLQTGAPVLARSVKLRPVIRRGQIADALVQDGPLSITMKVEALEDGAPGQTIRARNPPNPPRTFVERSSMNKPFSSPSDLLGTLPPDLARQFVSHVRAILRRQTAARKNSSLMRSAQKAVAVFAVLGAISTAPAQSIWQDDSKTMFSDKRGHWRRRHHHHCRPGKHHHIQGQQNPDEQAIGCGCEHCFVPVWPVCEQPAHQGRADAGDEVQFEE